MSRLSQNFVQKSFRFLLFIFFVSNLHAYKEVNINDLLSEIDVVSKLEDRRKGLMYKKYIPKNYGMFFIWEYEKKQCMWMKNTYVELNVAYIDKNGEILEIYDMVPLSKKSVCSKNKAKYALEVNKGWFIENSIQVGDVINIEQII